jgi:predicted DNA-binding transcriptional regulator AlpA
MRTLRQNYTVLWSKEDVDQWIAAHAVPKKEMK